MSVAIEDRQGRNTTIEGNAIRSGDVDVVVAGSMALVVTFPDIDVDDVEVRFDDGLGGGIVKVTIERPARATP